MAEGQTTPEVPKKRTRKPKPCNPTVTVEYGGEPMSAAAYKKFIEASARIYAAQFPPVIGESVRKIVAARGVESRESFVADKLSVTLRDGVEVSLEGIGRSIGVPIVRQNGEVVANGWPGNAFFKTGNWQLVVADALMEIWRDEMRALASPGCARCNGSDFYPDKDDFISCECTRH